tara:strand:- start:295 stop:477 length:183 start_codon:yes stop_codon:yes gene_type:complete
MALVNLTLRESHLSVSTNFEMTHEELGLRPFSVMMGALRVAETARLQIRLLARQLSDDGI